LNPGQVSPRTEVGSTSSSPRSRRTPGHLQALARRLR
jgi:hypothetical protein